MNKPYKILFLNVALAILLLNNLYSQPWMENLQNPINAGFYEIRDSFKNYWSVHDHTERGQGWNQFKRWEWFWEQRVYPTGEFPAPDHVYKELQKYRKNRKNNSSTTLANNWTQIGPSTSSGGYAGLGRVNVVRQDPNSTNILWAGSASGGLWKSTNSGQTWSTNTDNLSTLGISDIAIDPDDSNIIYLATGDKDWGDYYSTGILKSTNGGQSWSVTGLNWSVTQTRIVGRLLIHPDSTNILYAACSNGIFKTTDAGDSWSLVLNVSNRKPDMEFKPSSPWIIYYSGTFIYRSENSGEDWTQLTNGLPTNNVGRIALGVSEASNNTVYAFYSASDKSFLGLYRSANSGDNWSLRSNQPNILGWTANGSDNGGQGHYDLCLAIDQSDANIVYCGGINIWKTTNGGSNWSLNTMWYDIGNVETIHADQHDLWFVPGTDTLFSGNDGGVYRTVNGGRDWSWLGSGLRITQFYRLGNAYTNENITVAGCQDNGTKKINGSSWKDILGGDGMECFVDYTNESIVYASTQNGAIQKSTNGGNNFSSIKNNINEDGGWVTPWLLDPDDNSVVYAGYKNVWRSTNGGTNWSRLSNFSGSQKLNILKVSSSDTDYIYCSHGNNLYMSSNGGTSWQQRTRPGTLYLTYLAIDDVDPQTIWVTVSGYQQSNKVFKSTDAGQNWINISGSLPNVPANSIIHQRLSDDRLFVGMETGVYYRDNSMNDWQEFGKGLPNVIVDELEIHECSGKIRAATYGRGLWEADVPAPLSQTALTSPADGTKNVPSDQVQLKWTSVNNADSYRLQVSENQNMTNPLKDVSDILSTKYTLNNLQSNKVYYWRILASSGCVKGSWSEIYSFSTLLNAPILMQPLDNTVDFPIHELMACYGIENAENYNFQISTDSFFDNIVIDTISADSGINNLNLDFYIQYYWRVRASDGTGFGPWSEVWSFRTIMQPPGLNIPADDSRGHLTNIEFFWTKPFGADKYSIRIADDSSFNSLLIEDFNLDTNYFSYNIFDLDREYYWQVQARNDSSTSEWSETFSFKTGFLPPELINPADSIGGVSINPLFIWTKINRGDKYRLQIASDSNFSIILTDISNIADTAYSHTGLDNMTVYFWRVKASDALNESYWSATNFFTTKITTPELDFPADHASGLGKVSRLGWFTVNNADAYNVEISRDSSFTNPTKIQTFTNFFEFNSLKFDTKYYWKVNAEYRGFPGDWSEIRSFNTLRTKPELIEPVNNSYAVSMNPLLVWSSVDSSDSYSVLISRDKDFKDIVSDIKGMTDTTLSIELNENNSKIFWKAGAVGFWGNTSWSEIYNFTTVLSVPELILPEENAEAVPVNGTLIWEKDNSVDFYRLRLSDKQDFSDTIINKENVKTNQEPYYNLDYYTEYFWQVAASSLKQDGKWSDIRKFRTFLSPSVLIYPPDDTSSLPKSVRFAWTSIPNADSYELVISVKDDFSSIDFTKSTTDNNYKLDSLSYTTKYFWKVRGMEKAGGGEWSQIFGFSTGSGTDIKNEYMINDEISIVPVPARNKIQIDIPEPFNIEKIEIIDKLGRLIHVSNNDINYLSKNSINLDVSEFTNGVYYLKIYIKDNVINKKFIVLK